MYLIISATISRNRFTNASVMNKKLTHTCPSLYRMFLYGSHKDRMLTEPFEEGFFNKNPFFEILLSNSPLNTK